MKIAVAGTGYVGLSIATLLSQHHEVMAVDIIPEKVDLINHKKSPIQDEYIEKYLAEKDLNLTATLDAEAAYKDANFVVIAAPTNYDSKKNFFDTSAVEAVIKLVLQYNPDAIMVIKSTIPVGYTVSVREKFNTKNIIFSPEFLRESKALYDNLYPSRIIVGTDLNDDRLVKAAHMESAEVVTKVATLFTANQKQSGILASVSMAQFILESGYGKSELAQNANNCFGMKSSLSGNSWAGSAWDGHSVYTMQTGEQNTDGSYVTVTADFRKYGSIEDSIADHSAYLLGAMNGSKKRYEGLAGCTDYKKAVQIIKDGGYATSLDYVQNLCRVIEQWNLTQFDVAASVTPVTPAATLYRVRKNWSDTASQKGAFRDLSNAKACADKNPGYSVFDENGKAVYPTSTAFQPYTVRVSISDLRIRKGPGTNYGSRGFTGKGVFTIVAEATGKGASKWGLLKSFAGKRNGWISLDYVKKV